MFGKKKKEEEPVELEELDNNSTSDLIDAFQRQKEIVKKLNMLFNEQSLYEYRSNMREILMISSKIKTGNLRNTEVFKNWCDTEEFLADLLLKSTYPEIKREILSYFKDTESLKQKMDEYQINENISRSKEKENRILLHEELKKLKDEEISLNERLESIRNDWKEDPTQFDKKVLYHTLNEIKERNNYCEKRITEIENELGEKENEITENC